MAEKTPLRLACEGYAECVGSCPYDIHLYEPWAESCYEKCSANIDYAECWERYFMQKSEKGHLMDINNTIEKLRAWVRATREDGLGPLGTNLKELEEITDMIEAEFEASICANCAMTTPSESGRRCMMEIKDPIARLREIAATLDDAAASMSEHGFSIPGIKAKSIADEIEAQYMRLPVDADGVPIRPGDLMLDYETPRHVCGIGCSDIILGGYQQDGQQGMRYGIAANYRHVKPDTVESELAQFLTACGDDDPHYYDEQIAEYAERIRNEVQDG